MMKPGDVHTLKDWITWVHQQLRTNRDVVVLITGRPGDGKSHFANYLAHRVDKRFRVDVGTFFSGKTLIAGSERAKRGSAVVWDEIVEGGLSIEAMTSENRDVLKHLITGRSLNLLTIACAPKLKLFQGFTKEDRAHWWIHIPRRGVAVFHHVKDDNPYPGAKPFYPQQFILTGFPPMDKAEEEVYEQLKQDWRRKWHRNSDAYLAAKKKETSEDLILKEIKRRLHWLPASVQEYATTFHPKNKKKPERWEQQILDQLQANKIARQETKTHG